MTFLVYCNQICPKMFHTYVGNQYSKSGKRTTCLCKEYLNLFYVSSFSMECDLPGNNEENRLNLLFWNMISHFMSIKFYFIWSWYATSVHSSLDLIIKQTITNLLGNMFTEFVYLKNTEKTPLIPKSQVVHVKETKTNQIHKQCTRKWWISSTNCEILNLGKHDNSHYFKQFFTHGVRRACQENITSQLWEVRLGSSGFLSEWIPQYASISPWSGRPRM